MEYLPSLPGAPPRDVLTRREWSCLWDSWVFSWRKYALNNASLTVLIHLKWAAWNPVLLYGWIHSYFCYEKIGLNPLLLYEPVINQWHDSAKQYLFSVLSKSNSFRHKDVTKSFNILSNFIKVSVKKAKILHEIQKLLKHAREFQWEGSKWCKPQACITH